ncbi:MAG: hypothetical protein DI566_00715 [Microbacterium sp.]|nr:MAG: hypothetical protein DI566_00715 [Microbacterium sp.]
MTPDEELLAAIERAQARWPDASRSELVRRLALHGDRSAIEEATARKVARTRAIAELRALAIGASDADELAQLRAEWER